MTNSQLDALQGEEEVRVRFALRHPKLFCRKFHFFFLLIFFLSRLLLFVEPCDRHAQVQPRDPSVYEPDCREMANRERNKKILLELVKQPDNSRCADCGEPGEQIYKRWYVCYRNKVRRGSEFGVQALLKGLEIFRFIYLF